jgi:hypothetical protein
MSINLKPVTHTWDSGDEVMLQALLKKKTFSVAEPVGQEPDALDRFLNRKLRPNLSPLLAYSKTPRLAIQLMADFKLVPSYYDGYVTITWTEGYFHIASARQYTSDPGILKAMCLAVTDCVWKVLRHKEYKEWKEKENGGRADNLGV